MINTTSGNKKIRAINAEDVKEQLFAQLIYHSEDTAIAEVLSEIMKDIDALETVDTLNGKKYRRAWYPRVMVRETCLEGGKPFQIGDNTHHQLIVNHQNNCSYLSFLNIQAMISTDFADEGYTFVGEKPYISMGDDTEIVPFDMVWVEDGAKDDK